MRDATARSGPALQFRAGSSPIHRCAAGWKLAVAAGVGAAAIALDAIGALLALGALVAAGYVAARLPLRDLWRDARWLLLQGGIVVLLTMALRGPGAFATGVRTALQIVLVLLPMALVLRTTASEGLLEPLRRRLPERLAFALGATVRFLPVFAREAAELVEMQRLRGARLGTSELWHPGAWRDWLACVAFPMTVRAVEIAGRAAEAAEIRGVGTGREAPAARHDRASGSDGATGRHREAAPVTR